MMTPEDIDLFIDDLLRMVTVIAGTVQLMRKEKARILREKHQCGNKMKERTQRYLITLLLIMMIIIITLIYEILNIKTPYLPYAVRW